MDDDDEEARADLIRKYGNDWSEWTTNKTIQPNNEMKEFTKKSMEEVKKVVDSCNFKFYGDLNQSMDLVICSSPDGDRITVRKEIIHGEGVRKTEINWSAIGAVSIDEAQKFRIQDIEQLYPKFRSFYEDTTNKLVRANNKLDEIERKVTNMDYRR